MNLNIIGDIFGSSGYSCHTRQLANAFHELGYEVRLDCAKPQGWEALVNDAELLMLQRPFNEEMTTIMIGQPPFWRLALAENPKHFIGFLVWEGDKIPEYWMRYLLDERIDQVWVPSKHVKQAIINTLMEYQRVYRLGNYEVKWDDNLTDKIKIVPHGVDLSLFNPGRFEKKPDRPFTFLINKGWRGGMDDRGGVQFVLKAYVEEFSAKDNVRLICKLNPAYLTPNFNLKDEMEKIGLKKSKTTPEILYNGANITYNSLPQLYADSDIYVNASMAEGFNIPGLEAHAMGIPTIQTTFGGQMDYMTDCDYFLVQGEMFEVKTDIAYEGVQWKRPNIDELKKDMRTAYENKDKVKKTDKIIKSNLTWTWRDSAKKGAAALKEIKNE